METVQQNGRFTLFSSKFLSICSILYVYTTAAEGLLFKLGSTVRMKNVMGIQTYLY